MQLQVAICVASVYRQVSKHLIKVARWFGHFRVVLLFLSEDRVLLLFIVIYPALSVFPTHFICLAFGVIVTLLISRQM